MRFFPLALLLCGCAVDPTLSAHPPQAEDEQPEQPDGESEATKDQSDGRQAPRSVDGPPRWLAAAAADDADGDGFGVDDDCDDADSDVNPGAAEDCVGGTDDDCDGAVDCEDADCATAPPCVEDCADGLDNDSDGYTDCADDECWGACGVTVRSTLTGGSADVLYRFIDFSTAAHSSTFYVDLTAWSISGTVSVAGASGTTQCKWSIPEAKVAHLDTYDTFYYSTSSWSYTWRPDWRAEDPKATFSEGCPLHPDQDVLPPEYNKFTLRDTPSWRVVDVSLTTPSGPWYHGDVNIYDYRRHSGYIYMDGFLPELSPASASWSQ